MTFFKIKKAPRLLPPVFFLLAAILLLVYSDIIRLGVLNGLQSCAYVLIPSLFPFMTLSGILSESRAADTLQKALAPVMRHFFHLPACTACAVLMGMIGGYPIGAKMTAALLEQKRIDLQTAGRMLCFCVNAGPSFLISAVGAGLLGNLQSGLLLLCCQWISALTIGFLLGQKHPLPTADSNPVGEHRGRPFSAALVHGVQSGINGMLSVIAYVLLFSAVLEIFAVFAGTDGYLLSWIAGFMEVTTGCIHAAAQKDLVLIGFFVSFSGFSVFFQAISFFKGVVPSFVPFFLSRLAHGAITAIFVKIGISLFPQTVETVFSNFSNSVHPEFSSTPTVAILLIFLCGVLLFSFSTWNFRRLD